MRPSYYGLDESLLFVALYLHNQQLCVISSFIVVIEIGRVKIKVIVIVINYFPRSCNYHSPKIHDQSHLLALMILITLSMITSSTKLIDIPI